MPTEHFHPFGQFIQFFVGNDALQGANTDAVVGRGKIEKGAFFGDIPEIRRPAGQVRGIAMDKPVKRKGWLAELVDHMGLVALAEVGDVFLMRDIGFGQNHDIGRHHIEQIAHELHHFVCLREMDTTGAGLLP